MRSALHDPRPTTYGAAALGALAWLAFLAVAHHRIGELSGTRTAGTGGGPVRAAALCTLATTALAVLLLW
ncbi:hypothetical protein N566_00220 [Streptomycetaceae bacterium MP113-05]|nr:hypothetical protein N566_00220 [Streptomycetaceae bacterium MP113-05]